jgi:ferric-dicitrate binding protein FerR (iron transport regulator)
MDKDSDIVELLIRSAGRRAEPPEGAYRQVLAAATTAFHDQAARRRQRRWALGAGIAASLLLVGTLLAFWLPPVGNGGVLATVERTVGGVERLAGDAWQPLEPGRSSLGTGRRLRTRADGRAALALAGGESLRLAEDTEIMLDAPGRIYVAQGTVYVDTGDARGAARIEVVTPAGTARDLGTQFELLVAGAALRLRVREGVVALDHGGRSLTGAAGEQLAIDALGQVARDAIPADSSLWQWAESIAPTPDMDGKPAAALIAWAARETGRRLRYESPEVEERAASVILHGSIRNLPPLAVLEAMLATTDLEYVLEGDTMEIRSRDDTPAQP